MDEVRDLLASGDVSGAIRHLREHAEGTPLPEVAAVVAEAAALTGFDDLREAAGALAVREGAQELFAYGYACIERGVGFLAVPALERVVTLVPRDDRPLMELVAALQQEERHADVVEVLEPRIDDLQPWPFRYLLALSALLSGDHLRAAREHARVTPPADGAAVHAWLGRMLGRSRTAADLCPLDARDLRGWHYVLTGGILATLSPYGFAAGMTGRWAFVSDTVDMCRATLDRLRPVLDASGLRPTAVGMLPDRSSRILGLAAGELLGLPTVELDPHRPATLVIAYSLGDTDQELVRALHDRIDGQVVVEHATCWTDPPAIAADVSGFLHQSVTTPWGRRLRASPEGGVEQTPADERPEAEVAAEIVAAGQVADDGDGATPPDPVGVPAGMAAALRGQWPAGPRDRCDSPGPVRSSRFL